MGIEDVYKKFVAEMLPKIQQGLVITKDYFTDLFGRYVKYLIVMDSFQIIICLAIICIIVYFLRKNHNWIMEETDGAMYALSLIAVAPIILFFIGVTDLAKDIYIPEIRVYEQLQSNFTNNK